MSDTARGAVIAGHCRQLKLPAVLREYPALARQAANEDWIHEEFLHQLLETEVLARQASVAQRRVRESHFLDLKSLDQIDWDASLRGISRPKVAELATCGFIEGADDVLIAGSIGTGKTHLAIALGLEAARRRYRVAFVRAADLVRSLLEARDERTLTRLHQRYQRTALLIVDELGFVPFDRAGGELLFSLLSDRYERCSTLVTTNLSFGEWVQVFGDEKLTTAFLDRLGHHAHVLTTQGESYRMRRRRVAEPAPA